MSICHAGRADGLLLAMVSGDGQAWEALGDPAAALAALNPAGRREAALRAALAAETGLPLEGARSFNNQSACPSLTCVSRHTSPHMLMAMQALCFMVAVHSHGI